MNFNLSKIFKLQKEYDNSMYQKQAITNQELIFDRRVVAILVELGELSNEIQYFKYWKTNITRDKEKIAYELVDVLCFLMSFAFIHELSPLFVVKEQKDFDMTLTFLSLYKNVIKYQETKKSYYISKSIRLLLTVAVQLGIDLNHLEKYHQDKIKITFQRLKENY